MRYEGSIADNGSKKFAMLGDDNVSASMYEVEFQSVHLSFNDLNFVQGLKPDNVTYLCGESYWTGVEHDVSGCNFRNRQVWDNGTVRKVISHVRDNNTLKISFGNSIPSEFGCDVYGTESDGNYLYPECDGSSGNTGVWDHSKWDNSVFGD